MILKELGYLTLSVFFLNAVLNLYICMYGIYELKFIFQVQITILNRGTKRGLIGIKERKEEHKRTIRVLNQKFLIQ